MVDKLGVPHIWSYIGGGSSLLAIVIGLTVNSNKNAQIALDVAKQHGQELLEIRQELKVLKDEVFSDTRYRITDAFKDQEAIRYRFDRNEKIIYKLEDFVDRHPRLDSENHK